LAPLRQVKQKLDDLARKLNIELQNPARAAEQQTVEEQIRNASDFSDYICPNGFPYDQCTAREHLELKEEYRNKKAQAQADADKAKRNLDKKEKDLQDRVDKVGNDTKAFNKIITEIVEPVMKTKTKAEKLQESINKDLKSKTQLYMDENAPGKKKK